MHHLESVSQKLLSQIWLLFQDRMWHSILLLTSFTLSRLLRRGSRREARRQQAGMQRGPGLLLAQWPRPPILKTESLWSSLLQHLRMSMMMLRRHKVRSSAYRHAETDNKTELVGVMQSRSSRSILKYAELCTCCTVRCKISAQ